MKKYFIILTFLFMIIPTFVNAEKVYTKEYYLEGENPVEYPYKSDDFKTNVYQSKEKLDEHSDRVLLEEKDYIYNSLSFRYIVINNFEFFLRAYLSEVEVFYKNELVPYTYTCSYCFSAATTNLNNGVYYSDIDMSTYNEFAMIIDLGDTYNPEEIDLVISYTNALYDIIHTKHDIWFLKDKPINVEKDTKFSDAVIYKRYLSLNENKKDKYSNFFVDITESDILNKVYDNTVYSKEEKTSSFYELVNGKTYTYQDKVFKYYKIVNEDKKIIKEKIKKKKSTKSTNGINNLNNLNNKYLESNDIYKYVDITNDDDYISEKKETATSKDKITLKVTRGDMPKLSNNVYKEKSHIDINLPILFGIFLMLIFLMILALYKLKKES